MEMVSLKRSKSEKKDMTEAMPAMCEGDDYAYGLRIRLETEELKKLGFSTLPEVGGSFAISAKAKVVSVRQDESQHNDSKCVELQVTDMGIVADAKPMSLKKFGGEKKA